VHDLLQAQRESDVPDRLYQALIPHDGKPITTRLVTALQKSADPVVAGMSWRLERAFGMTHLKTREYDRGEYQTGRAYSFLLAYSEGAVPLYLKLLQEKNSCYFDARVKRNHARMEAMNTREALDSMANTMNAVQSALQALERAKAQLETLTAYGEPFNPDKYDIERACGLRKD
jgi:hypothetical protein